MAVEESWLTFCEPVEIDWASRDARVWAWLRVVPNALRAERREPVALLLVPMTEMTVDRADETASRASRMVVSAPSSWSARESRSSRTARIFSSAPASAVSAPLSTSAEPFTSFSAMTLPTVPAKVSSIWFSMVVAPVSVTLGEMALTFSFT